METVPPPLSSLSMGRSRWRLPAHSHFHSLGILVSQILSAGERMDSHSSLLGPGLQIRNFTLGEVALSRLKRQMLSPH